MENPNKNNNKINNKREEIRKYIAHHELNSILSEMLNSVIHTKVDNPYLYMIKYLGKFISDEDKEKFDIQIPGPYPEGCPIVSFPSFNPSSTALIKKHLDKVIWNQIKFRKTKNGANINDLTRYGEIFPDDQVGIFINEEDCIDVYKELFYPLIMDLHHFVVDDNVNESKQQQQRCNNKGYDVDEYETIIEGYNTPTLSTTLLTKLERLKFVFYRNLKGYPFNHKLEKNMRRDISSIILNQIEILQQKNVLPSGMIYSYTNKQNECDTIINDLNYDLSRMKKLRINKDWPNERYIYESNDKHIYILINFFDHLTIYFINNKTHNNDTIDITALYNKSMFIMKQLSFSFIFAVNDKFGYITSNVSQIGAGFSIISSYNVSPSLFELCFIKHKAMSFEMFLKYQNFEQFQIDNNNTLLTIEMSFKLKYRDMLRFMNDYFILVNGILLLEHVCDKGICELSFHNVSKDIKNETIKKCYNAIKDFMLYKLSYNGYNINYILDQSNNESIIYFKYKTDYTSFYPFVQNYLLITQHFNSDNTDHINQPEQSNALQQIESSSEYFDKFSNFRVMLIRNYNYNNVAFNEPSNEVEDIIKSTIEDINTNTNKNVPTAQYYSLDNPKTKQKALDVLSQNNIPYSNSINTKYKGVIVFNKEDIYALVNDGEHLQFLLTITHPRENIKTKFDLLIQLSMMLANRCNYVYDKKFGFLTSNIKHVGSGMLLSLDIKLSKIPTNDVLSVLSKTKKAKGYNCKILNIKNDYYHIQIQNKYTIGFSEYEILSNTLSFANYIVEKDYVYNNKYSKHNK